MRVLIVDDNADILETTADLLALRGYEVDTALSVREVLPKLQANPPDLLLQDCHMPSLDLKRLITSIRAVAKLKDLPILLFTASVEADEFWEEVGANGVVKKPFEAEVLRRAIDGILVHVPKH